jgi:hypothetical protein
MKKHLITLLVLSALIFASCDFSGESNYTPNIYFVHNPIRNNQDTLNAYFNTEAESFVMDTIQVGDTIRFLLYFEAYANKLVAFNLTKYPASAAQIILPPVSSMDSLFKSTSNYENGNFLMDPLYSSLVFPFSYVADAASIEARIDIAIMSDAIFEGGFGSNVNSIRLRTPIVLPPEPNPEPETTE